MNHSSDDESSDSSNECFATSQELDLDSTFFKVPNPKPSSTIVNDNDTSESEDDSASSDNIDSAALLAEVMKNLENAKKAEEQQKASLTVTKSSSPKKKQSKDVSTDEITNLLLQGESALGNGSFEPNDEDDVEESEDVKPPTNYTIPKEGVNITLPDTCVPMFSRRKKRNHDVEDMLRKKMNQQLRSKQVFVHKVGLLCWLAYGFHLNRLINDSEVLAVSLSLVPTASYPKGRVDINYLEQFTKWFRNLIRLEFKDIAEGVCKDMLLARLKDKKICNYRELVLLYAAMLRSIGLNCRLIVSLCPPALKLQRTQLFQIPKDESKSEISAANSTIKPAKRGRKVSAKSGGSDKSGESSKSKIVAENSSECDTKAKMDARKRAANVLAKFELTRVKKPMKLLPKKNNEDKHVTAKSPTTKNDVKSPHKHKNDAKSPLKVENDVKSPRKIKNDVKSPLKVENNVKSPLKIENDVRSPLKVENDVKSPPKTRQLRSRLISQNLASSQKIEKATKNLNSVIEKVPGKRVRTTRSSKTNGSLTSSKVNVDPDEETKILLPVKKKKIDENVVEAIVKVGSDSETEFEPKLELAKTRRCSKRIKPSETNKNASKSDPEPKLKKNNEKKIIANDSPEKRRRTTVIKKKEENDEENMESSSSASEIDEDEDFEPKIHAKSTKTKSQKNNSVSKIKREDSIDRRVLSSDDDSIETVDAKGAQNIWVEVFVDAEESWISVCVPDTKIHCVSDIYKKAPKPVLHVIAWNSVGTVKDVTRRYCPHWLTVTRKQRVDEKWWEQTLKPWKEKSSVISRAEDEMLLQRELEQPLPKTVGECKGHPLYALTRHLLKFEALYPPESVPLGHLKTGEAIYSRHCVHTLCSRETWLKKARVVKPNQEPYKIVKAMPKYDKLSGTVKRDLPLELFGKWQTTQYIPPAAKDGKVPRNEYGSVDLFEESMLPFGTVHVNLPALNRVARKLGIDCVPAVVGFNFGARGAMPVTEGYVVCTEFEETLREAWHEDQIESSKRAVEKREKRIYGNWRKLIKGLFIRERLAARYDFGGDDVDEEDVEKPSTSKSTHKDSRNNKTNSKRGKSKKS